jgi:nucleoside phosphorylase
MKSSSSTVLNIICALNCEAKALIHSLKLKKNVSHKTFQIYKNKDSTIQLIISGIGRINAAIATAYLASQSKDSRQAFLNIGIAGSSELAIGKLFLVNKLEDNAANQTFYPTYYPKVQFIKNFSSTSLQTYDTPVSDLPKTGLADMESTGFYQAALKFTSQENIQILKIVSDNSKEDQEHINSQFVNNLLEEQLESILSVIYQLQVFLKKQAEPLPEIYEAVISKFHVTEQQKIHLLRLLQRAEIFADIFNARSLCMDKITSVSALIKSLKVQLEECY